MSLGDVYQDLEDHLTAHATWDTAEGDGVAFVIDSLERADWAARKVAQARRRLAEAEMVADAELARVQDWIQHQRDRCENDTMFLLDLLERYHRTELDDDPKRKTISLPGGASLVARKAPDSLVVEDEAAAVAWCEANQPDAVVVLKKLDKPALKRVLSGTLDPATGELVPGLAVQTGEVKFSVKTDAAGDDG